MEWVWSMEQYLPSVTILLLFDIVSTSTLSMSLSNDVGVALIDRIQGDQNYRTCTTIFGIKTSRHINNNVSEMTLLYGLPNIIVKNSRWNFKFRFFLINKQRKFAGGLIPWVLSLSVHSSSPIKISSSKSDFSCRELSLRHFLL